MVLAGVGHAQPSETLPIAPAPETQPDTTVAGRLALVVDEYLGGGFELDVGRRLFDRIYLHGGAIYGASSLVDPAGSGQLGGSLYAASAGAAYIYCGPVGCRGAGFHLGYIFNSVYGSDALLEPPDWRDERHGIVVEVRAIARARLGSSVALEVAGSFRENTRVGGAGDRIAVGFGFSIGLVATI
jgi:hypothetical protein